VGMDAGQRGRMHVLHANWSGSKLHIWAESAALWAQGPGGPAAPAPPGVENGASRTAPHPYALPGTEIAAATGRDLVAGLDIGELEIALPESHGRPSPSTRLAHAVGHAANGNGSTSLGRFRAPAVAVDADRAVAVLDAIEEAYGGERETVSSEPQVVLGPTIAFFAAASRLARYLLAQQRFVPALRQEVGGELTGLWQPWVSDEATAARVATLLESMPPAARAAVDAFNHEPWPILEDFLSALVDAECRRTLKHENMVEAISTRDPGTDPQVAWLSGLLDGGDKVPAKGAARTDMVKQVRRWIAGLEDRGTSSTWKLCLRLSEPVDAALLSDMQDPGDAVAWPLTFHLQSQENPKLIVDASDIWLLPTDSITLEGRRLDNPQELLLAELGRASRLYPMLERALNEAEPAALELNTRQAYQYLREQRPILLEQGFGAQAPDWWDQPTARLGARLKLSSEALELVLGETGPGAVASAGSRLGLSALVNYTWDIAIGGTTLSLGEFEKLAGKRTPLVRINGQWVEVRPEDVKAAIKFIQDNPGGTMRVGDAIRLAYGSDARTTGIPIVGLEATGWVGAFFGEGMGSEQIPIVEPPKGFHGSLRPYQVRGMSWMSFLERFGFGPCLADDMGLGKTIQLLALLVHEREKAAAASEAAKQRSSEAAKDQAGTMETAPAPGAEGLLEAILGTSPEAKADAAAKAAQSGRVPPTLLVVPMSVVGNWIHEAKRFCPELKFMLHHGIGRLQGDAFVAEAHRTDAIITTYAIAHRDKDMLQRVHWQRVVLDEAQYIKNPATKQSLAVRSLPSNTRIALTGTPVENRLSELWSILDFLNPGYLGSAANFRKRFSVPVERYRDAGKGKQLRDLVKPFILRRLKTDPGVAADLPEKVESREYSHLTTEQAEMYESVVNRMLAEVDAAEGIQRRGLVLSTLIKLKQICNHPSQYLKDHNFDSAVPPAAARSGKCQRLLEMMDEAIGAGDQALVFTQFRQMGALLSAMLRHSLDKEVLFFHGGTPQAARVAMVDRFQKADGTAPVLVVSLKAGGVGLNLTAATHVFHFDRWWNPAVENQATDRAHRIGQYRTVQVHKFVVSGTLEERIDEMIEQKTELAENIIGSGEAWLTELNTDQLRDLLTLRRDAVGDDE